MRSTLDNIIDKARTREIRSLMSMGLTQEDAEDIFQDASMALYDAMSGQRLALTASPEAYLHGICQNMAYKRMSELKRVAAMVDDDKLNRLLALTEDDESCAVDEEVEEVDYLSVLTALLQQLSQRDYSLIHGFYLEGKSLDLLAAENSMASVEVARTTKCRIMNRLREQAAQALKNYY